MKPRIKLLSLLCTLALLATMLPIAAISGTVAAESYVQSFEDGGTTTLYAASGASTALSTDVAHTGENSIKMTINDDYGNQNTNRVVYEDAGGQVQFPFGMDVIVSYWVYSPVEMKAKARLIMDPDLATMGNWVSGKGVDLLETTLPAGEWVQVTETVTLTQPTSYASYDSTYLSVGVVYPDSVDAGAIDYTVYLDDVSIMPDVPQHEIQSYESGGTTYTVGTTAASTDVAHTGEKSLKLTIDADYGSANTNRAVYEDLSGRPVPLTVGAEYTLSAWVYFSDSFASKIRMVYDPNLSSMTTWASGKAGIEIAATQETGKWIYITQDFTAKALGSETVTYVSFGVAASEALPEGTTAYTAYVDDVYIAPKGTLVDNATLQDFESGSLAKVYGETAISTEQAHSGDYAVKMHIIDDRSNHNCERVLFEGDYGLKSFTVGKKYTVSAWVYAVESFYAKVKVISDPDLPTMDTWLSGKGQDLAVTTLPAGQWTYIRNTMTVSAIQGETKTYLSLGVTAADSVANTGDVSYTVYVDDVSIVECADLTAGIPEMQLSGTDAVSVGLKLPYSFSKTDAYYTDNVTGDYTASADVTFGLLSYLTDGEAAEPTVDTAGVTDTVCTTFSQDDSTLTLNYDIAVAAADLDKTLVVRPYLNVGGGYVYGETATRCAAALASVAYTYSTNEVTKARLETAFASSAKFSTEAVESLTFVAISDFHYNPGNTATSLQDLKAVLKRADDENAAFVMSLGDFHNDAAGNPEQFEAYHNNGYDLNVYNIYGNHELETTGNSMEVVTPTLTNDEGVVWGTADGTMDPSIGYYYFENSGFRMICLDNNYYTDSEGVWHHNAAGSYGAPEDAVRNSCLGDVQTAWLTSVLDDAAQKDIPCLIMIHIPIDGVLFAGAGDAAEVRAILNAANEKNPGTVLAVFNGHEHVDNQVMVDGILYKYINVTRGCKGDWSLQGTDQIPYQGMTYEYEEYDAEGNLVSTTDRLYTDTTFNFSYYSTDAMSSLVTVYTDGTIIIDGYESTWLGGEVPTCDMAAGTGPRHSTLSVAGGAMTVGHVHVTDEVYLYDETGHWTGCGTCDELTENYEAHTAPCDVCGYGVTATFVQSFENGGTTTLFAASGASTALSTEQAHTGENAIKMVINDDYGNQNTNRVVYEDADGQKLFPFGKQYTVSFWLYAPESFNARVRLVSDPDLSSMAQWVSGKGMDLAVTTLPAGQWVQVEETVTLTASTTWADITETYLSVGVTAADSVDAGAVSYTVYLDDVSIVPVPEEETETFTSTLNGKTALFSGDSIAAGWRDEAFGKSSYTAGGGWSARLENLWLMNATKAAIAGNSFTELAGRERIIDQLHANKDGTYDYVILQGGFNDCMGANSNPVVDTVPALGEISGSFNVEDFDTTTFAGAFEELLYYATTYYPEAAIGFIVTYQTPLSTYGGITDGVTESNEGYTQADYFNLQMAICDKWNVDFLDLWSGVAADGKTYSGDILDVDADGVHFPGSGDNIHLNTAGYDAITPYIATWMEGLSTYEAPATVSLKMNAIESVYQYVGGSTDNSSLQAEAGSAVYTHADGSLRTAFRVPGSYVTDSADFSTILLDGVSYPILERGIILGTEGQTLTVNSPLKTAITSGFKDKYWKYDSATGTVTYTALVKNVSEEMVSTSYIARSYVKISVGGNEQIIYSDVSGAFTPQSLYDKAAAKLVAEGKPAPVWFPTNDKTDDGIVDLP